MCTAATYTTKNHYFGRNLDYEFSYGENITIAPRNFPFKFRHVAPSSSHFALLGVAYVTPDPDGNDFPLFYDAINEKGLGMAGLNFVGNAVFHPAVDGEANIAQFELIPWILGQCSTVAEARTLFEKMNFVNTPFSTQLPPSELHWILSDTKDCIVVETVENGVHIYDNPAGVLTNNPPFDKQLFSLNNLQHLSATAPTNTFAPNIPLETYSRGMGAIGLPGDLSSQSRFAKAAFTRAHSLSADDELSSVSQFFHILHSVDQQRGCCDLGNNKYEITIYSSCYNLEQGICYYTSYDNHQITSINMHKTDLDNTKLTNFPMITTEQINYQN